MCNPIALTAASMVGTLFTQHQQGKAQAAMYNQQARVAEANARISDRKQEQIADQALQERDKMSDKMRLIQGQNVAETGASGLTMSGTPLQLMASSYDEYNKDIQNWETNKNNSIYNEYLNGMNYRNEASTARAAASNAKSQTRMAMLGTILSGASSIYGLKSQYASKNVGSGNNYYAPSSDALAATGMPKMKFVTKGAIRNNRWGI